MSARDTVRHASFRNTTSPVLAVMCFTSAALDYPGTRDFGIGHMGSARTPSRKKGVVAAAIGSFRLYVDTGGRR